MAALAASAALAQTTPPARPDNDAMVRQVVLRARQSHIGRDKYWRDTVAAMRALDRKDFVPGDQRDHAYEDKPLAIGYGQTISDPFIVAVMTSLLHLGKGGRVLEIGTGSGYQTAVLARLAREVWTIEIIAPLLDRASKTLDRLGIANVHARPGDGYGGWPEGAPFDAAIVTAGAPYIPQPLLDQLKPGGRMVIPLGEGFWNEELVLVVKDRTGRVRRKNLGPVMFVDFTGKIRKNPKNPPE